MSNSQKVGAGLLVSSILLFFVLQLFIQHNGLPFPLEILRLALAPWFVCGTLMMLWK